MTGVLPPLELAAAVGVTLLVFGLLAAALWKGNKR